MNRLGKTLDHARDGDLVDHLGELAGACRAHQTAGAGKAQDGRLDTGVDLGVAAAHHGQCRVLGAGLPAGDRGVDEGEAGGLGRFVKFTGDLGRGGGVVDEDRAFLHSREGAVRSKGDAAQVVVVADAGEDDLLSPGGLARGRGMGAAMRRDPGLRLRGRSIVDGDLVALAGEVAGHRPTHHAEAQERDLRHRHLRSYPEYERGLRAMPARVKRSRKLIRR